MKEDRQLGQERLRRIMARLKESLGSKPDVQVNHRVASDKSPEESDWDSLRPPEEPDPADVPTQ